MFRNLLVALFIILSQFSLADEGNWQLIDRYETRYDDTTNWGTQYIGIDCADKNNFMAFGIANESNRLGRATTDGGNTWHTVYRDSLRKNAKNIYAKVAGFAYPDTSLALVLCDSCLVMRSTDKGASWSENRLKCPVTEWRWMQMKMYKNFGAIIAFMSLYITTDGGLSWNKNDIVLDDSLDWTDLDDLSIPDSNTIIIGSYDLKKKSYFIIYSTDRGNTWNFNPAKDDFFKFRFLFFTDRDNGYAVGNGQISQNSSIFKSVIIHTTDRGKTWTKQLDTLPGDLAWLSGFDFIDSLNGIAWSENSYRLWNTTDGGQKWNRIDSYWYTNLTAPFKDMKMISPDTWLGATVFYTDIYKYSRTTGSGIQEPPESQNHVSINPNVINAYDELNISFDAQINCRVKFEIVNSIGNIVDYSDTYYLARGINQLSYNPKGVINSGSYWLKANIDGQSVSIQPFVVIK